MFNCSETVPVVHTQAATPTRRVDLIEESQNVGYNHKEMLKLLELNGTDYIIVIKKGKGNFYRC
jgi:hypothetical protein